jgi:hypothetical protein
MSKLYLSVFVVTFALVLVSAYGLVPWLATASVLCSAATLGYSAVRLSIETDAKFREWYYRLKHWLFNSTVEWELAARLPLPEGTKISPEECLNTLREVTQEVCGDRGPDIESHVTGPSQCSAYLKRLGLYMKVSVANLPAGPEMDDVVRDLTVSFMGRINYRDATTRLSSLFGDYCERLERTIGSYSSRYFLKVSVADGQTLAAQKLLSERYETSTTAFQYDGKLRDSSAYLTVTERALNLSTETRARILSLIPWATKVIG